MTTAYEQLKAMGEACIDNTLQQVESLAKQVEWKSGDKCQIDGYGDFIFGCATPSNVSCIVFTSSDSFMLMPIERLKKPESPQDKEKQVESLAKQVEWENGDECKYIPAPEDTYLVIGMHPTNNKIVVCWSEKYGIAKINIDYLCKPESPEDKAAREREENGKALFELKVSLTSISCIHWDDQAESSKESWRQFAELVTLKDDHKE